MSNHWGQQLPIRLLALCFEFLLDKKHSVLLISTQICKSWQLPPVLLERLLQRQLVSEWGNIEFDALLSTGNQQHQQQELSTLEIYKRMAVTMKNMRKQQYRQRFIELPCYGGRVDFAVDPLSSTVTVIYQPDSSDNDGRFLIAVGRKLDDFGTFYEMPGQNRVNLCDVKANALHVITRQDCRIDQWQLLPGTTVATHIRTLSLPNEWVGMMRLYNNVLLIISSTRSGVWCLDTGRLLYECQTLDAGHLLTFNDERLQSFNCKSGYDVNLGKWTRHWVRTTIVPGHPIATTNIVSSRDEELRHILAWQYSHVTRSILCAVQDIGSGTQRQATLEVYCAESLELQDTLPIASSDLNDNPSQLHTCSATGPIIGLYSLPQIDHHIGRIVLVKIHRTDTKIHLQRLGGGSLPEDLRDVPLEMMLAGSQLVICQKQHIRVLDYSP